ncbi:MAG: glycosyltransferase, partial [Anaerolineae bacterium]|nr:glycosyltransferase [Anaerolineae bacterium]
IMHRASVSGRMRDSVQRRDEILRSTLDNVDLVICPSRYLIHKFGEFGFNTDRFHFIRQGLARPNYSRSSRSQPDVLSLGYIGQIKHHKGVDLLIDAVLPLLQAGEPLILEIWGSEQESPDYTRMLKQRSSRYQANIRWHGRYTGNKVWDVLSEIDVLVVPSRWYENSPNVILEAYEMGIPVIATDLGGMSELVLHEQSGLLFEIDNVSDLRGQINRLLHQPNLLNQLRSGVPNVKTIDEEMAEIVAEYKKLLLDAENV